MDRKNQMKHNYTWAIIRSQCSASCAGGTNYQHSDIIVDGRLYCVYYFTEEVVQHVTLPIDAQMSEPHLTYSPTVVTFLFLLFFFTAFQPYKKVHLSNMWYI